jgi:hypothetical protein
MIDLQQHTVTDISIPGRPLDIAIVSKDGVAPGCKNKSVREKDANTAYHLLAR